MLVGRSGLSPVMVGRAVELDRLVGLLGARSTPTVALVAGEAGIGKTRLVRGRVRRAPADMLVLAGQADPGTVGRPLELLLDALEGHTGESDPELLEAVHDAGRPAEERVRAGVDLVRRLTADAAVRVVDALHGRTGGNPFFLEELVSTSVSAPVHDLGSMPLPWTVAELVSSQVDALDPAVTDMLTSASVLGRRVSFDLLAAVTGASEDELISRLHAAVESGLLVETDPDVFSFHHEL